MKLGSFFTAAAVAVLCAVAPVRAGDDLSALNVYPNPVRASAGDTAATFDNLTQRVTIRIYTAHGVLVRRLSQDDPGFRFRWDLSNDDGEKVASGIYVFVVTNDAGEKKTGKLALIR